MLLIVQLSQSVIHVIEETPIRKQLHFTYEWMKSAMEILSIDFLHLRNKLESSINRRQV